MLTDSGSPKNTTRRVVFSSPFSLGASPEVYRAGTYDVETAEDTVAGNEHTAHVRTSTVLIIPTPSGTRHINIRGSDLDAALKEDAERQTHRAASENPDRGEAH
jgi:hypothetical protein